MIAEIILILSVILLTAGVFFEFGLGWALMASGLYLGVIAFAIAASREG